MPRLHFKMDINWKKLTETALTFVEREKTHLEFLLKRNAPLDYIERSRKWLNHYQTRAEQYSKYIVIFILFFGAQMNAQHNNSKELNTNTPTSKFVQGAFTGTALYIVANELQRENKWISHTVSILGSLLFEAVTNKKTNLELLGFNGGGALSVNITFEIFKGKPCNRHNY